ncbi:MULTISPECIES: gamma-glutamyltransferase [unclassified Chelatococcus]|uniref:gamma-glutamyltransferase n=1 Tax=unclassified Chelatococcus TaxID=2638111 RepID=UPI001BCEFD30|nr:MULTISPECIES: gamma-glutamyltransferase [unclassified Chelatococcus]MBS7696591.1 gamma-glutamyltransferase [Chelatococcus sp. YT9]MBX3555156.1 gamma-glutamyltransferase [Chelatococcus sp.]
MTANASLPGLPTVSPALLCEKTPVRATKGMVVTNHPLASQAASQMLLSGGNAIDAAVAALFALTVVEPMMVGVLGGGLLHIRQADGSHCVIDALSTAPAAARAGMYETVSDVLPDYQLTVGRRNETGAGAVAVPGALAGWCEALRRFGKLPLGDVVAPAIQLATRGFTVTPYLVDCITDAAADLARDAGLAGLYLPGGMALQTGDRLIQGDYAATLQTIADEGAPALYQGVLGAALASATSAGGGSLAMEDLASYATVTREVIRSHYRGFEIVGPPPPSSAGVHIAQMLNILEAYDIGALGFGSADSVHLLAEVLKIAFADRAVATADPAFIEVPVGRLIDPDYAAERRAALSMEQAKDWLPGIPAGRGLMPPESPNTTHVTTADSEGNVVAATQTINSVFGARVMVPGTGMVANNYMFNFDPHPGRALSIAPGKRVFTSQAPMMALRDGRIAYALGLPGGLRIFGSAMQALINLIDHGMGLQEAVEAPRVWTQGWDLEIERGIDEAVQEELTRRGHRVTRVGRVAGGMNAIAFHPDGSMTGAACWRADGTVLGIGGGLARPGVRFSAH